MAADYVSTAEAAEDLGVSRDTVKRLCRAGEIQGALKVGRSWIIPTPVIRLYPERVERRGRRRKGEPRR